MRVARTEVSILGSPPSAARAVHALLGAGAVIDDPRRLADVARQKDARVVYALRSVEAAVRGSEPLDAAARALAEWSDAASVLYEVCGRPRDNPRVFVLHCEWLLDGQDDYLGALLAFAGVEPSDAIRARLAAWRAEEAGLASASAEVRELVERHGERWLERAAVGFAAGARLRWTLEPPSMSVRKLARLDRWATDRVLADRDRALTARTWRIDRLLARRGVSGPRGAAAEAVAQAKIMRRALSAGDRPEQLARRVAHAWRRIARADRRDAWRRDPAETLECCAGLFRLPGGGGAPFVLDDGRLVSLDGEHAYDIRDAAVQARPSDVRLARGSASAASAPPEPRDRVALDVGCKSGDGFAGFLDDYAALVGLDPAELDAVVGVDLDEVKLAGAVDVGLLPVLADGSALPFRDDSFDVVVAMELLEHVPPEVALGICREIRRVSRGAVFIQNPDFGEEAYLASLGLKFSWMGWPEHCHHITRETLAGFLREAGWPDPPRIERVFPVADSSHPLIVPLGAPPRTRRYTEALGPKPAVTFDRPVFEKLRVVLRGEEAS